MSEAKKVHMETSSKPKKETTEIKTLLNVPLSKWTNQQLVLWLSTNESTKDIKIKDDVVGQNACSWTDEDLALMNVKKDKRIEILSILSELAEKPE